MNNLIQLMNNRVNKIKYPTLILCLNSISNVALAQDEVPVTKSGPLSKVPDVFFEPTNYLWVFLAFIILAVMVALSRAVKVLALEVIKKKDPVELKQDSIIKPRRVSAWSRLMDRMTRSVPIEQEADVMLDHEYDGIRELDNKLPPWWVWGFYLTIVFSFVYLIHFHVSGTGSLQIEEYNNSMLLAQAEKENRIKNDENFVTEANVKVSVDQMVLNEGQGIYVKNCVACHGDAGQGGVGPNLTDQFWVHGGGIKNVFKVISDGVPSKGMISWKSQLSPKQIQAVGSYILTMQGTSPHDPKEAQGERWEEPEVIQTSDSTQQAKLN